MENKLSFKELYSVSLKTTSTIEVNGRKVETGETIALFDSIQIANFQEVKQVASANGGYDNRALIVWENTKELKLNLTQGVFSKAQFALMVNSKLTTVPSTEIYLIPEREVVETDELGIAYLKRKNAGIMFVYDQKTGEKITNYEASGNMIVMSDKYRSIIVDYQYEYDSGYQTLQIGRPFTAGFLSLTGKMRIKDDTTGKVVTGIIKIPKLRLMSDLSMRVGSDAIPQVGRLDAVAVPEGARGQQKVMEIIFLNDDIDADM